MKTIGQRIKHVREDLLRMTQQDFLPIVKISGRSLSVIEQNEGGERALKEVIHALGLSESWVETGKGEKWISGDDEENISRIKALKPGAVQTASNPWQDETYKLLREENAQLRKWIDSLMGKVSFLNQSGKASYKTANAA